MKNFRFLSFWLLLTVGMATVVFNSCGKDDDPNNPDDPNNSNTIAVTGIGLNVPTLTLLVGETQDLIATVTPDNATDKTVTWTSSDTNKATVDTNGKVTAQSAGEVTITAKAGNETADCKVTVKEKEKEKEKDPSTVDNGVIINGVKWATRNVAAPGKFAAKPEDSGMFYQWNRKKAWPATGDVTDWDVTDPEGDSWATVNDPSPVGWRVPTLDEIKSLLDTEKVTNEWTTQNGVNGRKFTDIASGNSLFLPAVGNRLRSDGRLDVVGTCGFYWSSTQYNSLNAYYLVFNSFNSVDAYWSSLGRRNGLSVRVVAE